MFCLAIGRPTQSTEQETEVPEDGSFLPQRIGVFSIYWKAYDAEAMDRENGKIVVDQPGEPFQRMSANVKSVKTGFSIVRILAAASNKLSLSEIATAAGMAPSNVHRYLASLLQVGLVVQDPITSRYRLGPAAIRIGQAAVRQADLLEVAHGPLDKLRHLTRRMVCLCVWRDEEPVVVLKLQGEACGFPMSVRVGSPISMTRHAAGHLFLAFLPEQTTRPLLEGLLQNRADAIALRSMDLAKIRAERRSVVTLLSGFHAASAPIFNHANEIVATCSVVGIPCDARDGLVEFIARAAQDAAREISIQLGQDAGTFYA